MHNTFRAILAMTTFLVTGALSSCNHTDELEPESPAPQIVFLFSPGGAQVIDDASASSFRPFFDRYISKDAKVITDEWSGYLPLKKDYPKLEQRPSDKGKGHPQIHIHIMNIKGWLRGIHHHCSKEHLQGYLDEYHFRFNRRNNMDTIFDMLLRRMICQKKTD